MEQKAHKLGCRAYTFRAEPVFDREGIHSGIKYVMNECSCGAEETKNTKNSLEERLADIEHQRWSDWQSWCHKILRENCPSPELEKVLERWDRQISTPYLELSETEKESDRKQVRRYLPILEKEIAQAQEANTQEIVEIIEDFADKGRSELRDGVFADIIQAIKGDTTNKKSQNGR